jgi:hypothetical protein
MSIQDAAREIKDGANTWREESSIVAAVKSAYRSASKVQRAQIRAWMRRVLLDKDGAK